MTDDLEAMGGLDVAAIRERADSTSSTVDVYEGFLRAALRDRILDLSFIGPRTNPGSVEDAHAAVLRVGPRSDLDLLVAGRFLSLVYKQAPDEVIVYDLPFPLRDLGYGLPKDKVLVNRGALGTRVGLFSVGVVVNHGRIPDRDDLSSRGWFINLSKTVGPIGVRAQNLLAFSALQYGDLLVDVPNNCVVSSVSREYASGQNTLFAYQVSAPCDPDTSSSVPLFFGTDPSHLDWCGRSFRGRENTLGAYLSWIERIGTLAKNDPRELLRAYDGGTIPARRRGEVAVDELFNILFEPRGPR